MYITKNEMFICAVYDSLDKSIKMFILQHLSKDDSAAGNSRKASRAAHTADGFASLVP